MIPSSEPCAATPPGWGASHPAQKATQTLGEVQHDAADDDEDDCLYAGQEDAQSFIQPSISPVATRLASSSTPAAERAAAMEDGVASGVDEYFAMGAHRMAATEPSDRIGSASTRGHLVPPDENLETRSQVAPSPAQAKNITDMRVERAKGTASKATTAATTRKSLPGMFVHTQHGRKRSASVGAEALRRLSRALPSISLPAGLLANLPNSGLFSSNSPNKTAGSHSTSPPVAASNPGFVPDLAPSPARVSLTRSIQIEEPMSPGRHESPRPPSMAPRRVNALRRSMSDESLLYHSLSKSSSLVDEDRFEKIRDMGNTRLRAILDSFPEVKMPRISSQCLCFVLFPLRYYCVRSSQSSWLNRIVESPYILAVLIRLVRLLQIPSQPLPSRTRGYWVQENHYLNGVVLAETRRPFLTKH